MHRKTAVVFALLAVVEPFAYPGASTARATVDALTEENVTICHRTGPGIYRAISASAHAVDAHRAHGDGVPGENVPGDPYLKFESECALSATFDPVADFDAGWLSGSNPNGVWSYGWSSALGSPLILYTQNYTTTQDCAASVYRAWNEPSNDLGFTPAVIKNTGPTCSNGNVDIPTGVMTQHFGGLSGTDYSHVVFTAPFSGTYTIAVAFTGRQNSLSSDVNVLVNGTVVLTDLITANLQVVPYTTTLTLAAGNTVDFATGPGPFGGLHPGHIGLSGTIAGVPVE